MYVLTPLLYDSVCNVVIRVNAVDPQLGDPLNHYCLRPGDPDVTWFSDFISYIYYYMDGIKINNL